MVLIGLKANLIVKCSKKQVFLSADGVKTL